MGSTTIINIILRAFKYGANDQTFHVNKDHIKPLIVSLSHIIWNAFPNLSQNDHSFKQHTWQQFFVRKKIGDFTPRLRVSLQSGGTGTLCRAQPTPGCRPRSCPKTSWLFLWYLYVLAQSVAEPELPGALFFTAAGAKFFCRLRFRFFKDVVKTTEQ